MKYIKKFKTNSDYQLFVDGAEYVEPHVVAIEENTDKPITYKKVSTPDTGLTYPITLTSRVVDKYNRFIDASPESIAFLDYIKNNGVWDGRANFDVVFEPGMFIVDGAEVQKAHVWSRTSEFPKVASDFSWYPSYDYDYFLTVTVGYFEDDVYPKGTIHIYDDDQ